MNVIFGLVECGDELFSFLELNNGDVLILIELKRNVFLILYFWFFMKKRVWIIMRWRGWLYCDWVLEVFVGNWCVIRYFSILRLIFCIVLLKIRVLWCCRFGCWLKVKCDVDIFMGFCSIIGLIFGSFDSNSCFLFYLMWVLSCVCGF